VKDTVTIELSRDRAIAVAKLVQSAIPADRNSELRSAGIEFIAQAVRVVADSSATVVDFPAIPSAVIPLAV
jgi:hypothetical protein